MKHTFFLRSLGTLSLLFFTLLIAAQMDADLPTDDQQILDDLIVDGSICAGQDCSNGESFGFDTLRLKENNLRIRAFDTSTSASFPSRDWQITFNDSSNGGQNKFSIDDIDGGRTPFTLEAGAPSHSLYVDDGGRVGFGTATPVVELHSVDGNTPTLRLEQDGSDGFTPQTWDLAGNESNFFIRDATNGSTLPFRVFPRAPSNSLVIEENTGDIGIGTTSPTANLHVLGNTTNSNSVLFSSPHPTNNIIEMSNTSNAAVQFRFVTNSSNRRIVARDASVAQSQLEFGDGGVFNFFPQMAATFTTLTAGSNGLVASSSRSLKSNIKNVQIPNILDRISAVPVTTYNWRRDLVNEKASKREVMGLIAEDFYTVLERGTDKQINSQDVQMALWLAVQKLHTQNQEDRVLIEQRDDRIRTLEEQVASLLKKFDELVVTDIELNEKTSAGYLKQNIPNPFDDKTQITYEIPNSAGSASLRIMNMKGQLVEEIAITERGKGIVNIEAAVLPQGTYSYSLIIDGDIIATNRMILAK